MDEEDGLGDAVLLADCAARPELFAVLYRRHVEAVLAYFARRTGCPQTAADLTAETFAAVFIGRGSYRDLGVPVRAWVFGIARRQLGTYLRRERVADRSRRRMGIPPLAAVDAGFERVEQLADLPSLRAALDGAVTALGPAQAEAVQLRIVDELPYAEVAARLGVTEGAARVRVSRGLTRLADLVDLEVEVS